MARLSLTVLGRVRQLMMKNEAGNVTSFCLTFSFIPSSEGEVGAGKISIQVGKSFLHENLHPQPLVLGIARRETKTINGPPNPDTDGVDGGLGVDVGLDLVVVHVTLSLVWTESAEIPWYSWIRGSKTSAKSWEMNS